MCLVSVIKTVKTVISASPTVTVKMWDTTIDASNYEVTYTNNTNAWTANFTVTAKSSSTNFTGSKSGNSYQ